MRSTFVYPQNALEIVSKIENALSGYRTFDPYAYTHRKQCLNQSVTLTRCSYMKPERGMSGSVSTSVIESPSNWCLPSRTKYSGRGARISRTADAQSAGMLWRTKMASGRRTEKQLGMRCSAWSKARKKTMVAVESGEAQCQATLIQRQGVRMAMKRQLEVSPLIWRVEEG